MNSSNLINLDPKKAVAAAHYLILKNQKDKKGLTNKKLQKLLYYA